MDILKEGYLIVAKFRFNMESVLNRVQEPISYLENLAMEVEKMVMNYNDRHHQENLKLKDCFLYEEFIDVSEILIEFR